MIRRALALLAWLLAGHAAWLALFWGLLNVPESNVPMLGLSAVIVLALLLVAAIVEGTAGAWLLPGRTFREAWRTSPGSVGALLLALLVVALFWWIAGRLDDWHAARRGEIDAWMIATFQATSTAWLHRGIAAVSFVLRAIVGVSIALALFFAWLEGGGAAILRLGWIRAGVSRDQLMLVAAAVTLFVAIPAAFAYWRPANLPLTWVQPAFAATKLGLLFVSVNVGWLICLVAAARNASVRG